MSINIHVQHQKKIRNGDGFFTCFSIVSPSGETIVLLKKSREVAHIVVKDAQLARLDSRLATAPKSENHQESDGFEIVHLDHGSVKWIETIEISVSNGHDTLCFDPELPLFAITHNKGSYISLVKISQHEDVGSYVSETFNGSLDRKITALSIGKRSDSIRNVACGDSIGNIKVFQIDLFSQNSARCIGRVDDTAEQNFCFNDVSPIICFNWSNQILWSTNSKGKFWTIDTSIDQTWEIKTPMNSKSPSMLDAVSNTITMLNVTNVLIHLSYMFLVMVCSSGKKNSRVTIHPIPLTNDASSLVGISNYSCNSFVRSMTFDNTGSILFLGCSKMIIALRVSPNGDTMTELWSHPVGNDRYISSLVFDEKTKSLTASDLSGDVDTLNLLLQ